MAKKILKRSLALGALMAFVITGSAMAATHENVVNIDSVTKSGITDELVDYNGDLYKAGVNISNSKYENNTFTSSIDIYGNIFRVMNKDGVDQPKSTIKDTVFNGNIGKSSVENAYVLGGAIMIKGGTTNFIDVDFDNNIAEATAGLHTQVGGGAIYVDATINTTVQQPTGDANVNFIINKDVAYTGNTIVSKDNGTVWYDTYGGAAQSKGGFLFIDRDASVQFNVNNNATLTIGNVDSTDVNADTIASVIPIKEAVWGSNSATYDISFPVLKKTGAGTMTINSSLNDYYGKLWLVEGTLNIAKDLELKNEFKVDSGSTLSLANVVIKDIPETVTGRNRSNNGEATLTLLTAKGSLIASGATVTATSITNDIAGGKVTFNNSNFEGQITTGAGTSELTFGAGNTWNVTGASYVTDVTFGAGSTLTIDDGSKYTGGKYAVAASGNAEIEDGAKLVVNGVKEETYNIVKAGTINGKWADSDITIDNALMSYEWSTEDAKKLDLVVKPKSADEITSSTGVNSSTGSMLAGVVNTASSNDYNTGDNAGVDFIVNAMAGQASGNTPEGAGTAINSALQIGEAGGNSGTALSVVNNVASVTTQRLSFSQMNTAPQGGHGKVERKYKSGAGVWAQYMHGKDKVEDMPMDSLKSSYESQYNGAVIGYDFKEVGKTQTGIAFNYGEGDSHSTGGSIATRSDFDFWGVGLYHNIMNDDTNLIFDINYSKSDSDVTQINGGTTLTANPETTTLSAGVKVEKLIQNGPVQIVPYAGLRYMTVDTDDYAANIAGKKAFMYAPDRQNIWLIPVGVSLRQENTYENGWRVTPKADLSYIWAVGDTDSSMTVSIPGITNVANMNYTVMDDGSFLGTVGVEAEKGDWTYGLSYSYQKGEYQRSDKWFVDVRYSF